MILTKEELARHGLTGEGLSPQNPAARRLMARLLILGKRETGMALAGKRLSLQVVALPQGGAAFVFTALALSPEKKGEGELASSRPISIFGFSQLSLLTEGCAKLFLQFGGQIHQSALYQWEGLYYLVLLSGFEDSLPVSRFLREYTSLIYDGPVFLSFLAEHGKPLIARDALKILASL